VKTIVMCSGGLDSVTLAHKVAAEGTLTRLVSFDYSQRHNKEPKCARRCATRLMAPRVGGYRRGRPPSHRIGADQRRRGP
jgi:7-cyano-7-deazaguanine synthase in queuosine biosynthesis